MNNKFGITGLYVVCLFVSSWYTIASTFDKAMCWLFHLSVMHNTILSMNNFFLCTLPRALSVFSIHYAISCIFSSRFTRWERRALSEKNRSISIKCTSLRKEGGGGVGGGGVRLGWLDQIICLGNTEVFLVAFFGESCCTVMFIPRRQVNHHRIHIETMLAAWSRR